MPFVELQDGTEILLEVDDLPEPPAYIFTDNPYLKEDPMFNKWRRASVARYIKAQYKAVVVAKNEEHFLSIVGDARAVLNDPTAWESYLSCRGLDVPKRPVGRPRLTEEEKVQRQTKVKRSDQMKVLLLEHDIIVSHDGSLHSKDGYYVGWKFQINGRVRFEDEDPISIHKFLTLI